jgi:hypothetical protein
MVIQLRAPQRAFGIPGAHLTVRDVPGDIRRSFEQWPEAYRTVGMIAADHQCTTGDHRVWRTLRTLEKAGVIRSVQGDGAVWSIAQHADAWPGFKAAVAATFTDNTTVQWPELIRRVFGTDDISYGQSISLNAACIALCWEKVLVFVPPMALRRFQVEG